MFIGAIHSRDIDVSHKIRMGMLEPYLTSLPMSLQSDSGFADAPLWLPKVRASYKSCLLKSLSSSTNGQTLPCMRMASICDHNG
jgi:hypothetical protein